MRFVSLIRKPMSGPVSANVAAQGSGAFHIDAIRVGTEGGGTHCSNRDPVTQQCLGHKNAGRSTVGETFHGPDTSGGRWPSNVILHEGAQAFGSASSLAQRFFKVIE